MIHIETHRRCFYCADLIPDQALFYWVYLPAADAHVACCPDCKNLADFMKEADNA